MSDFSLTPSAEADIKEIVDHIRKERPLTAVKVARRLRKVMKELAAMPGLGHLRRD